MSILCPKCKKYMIPHYPLRELCFYCWKEKDESKEPVSHKEIEQ
jgi:hypothetical protein